MIKDYKGFFEYKHLPPSLQEVSKIFCDVGNKIIDENIGEMPSHHLTSALNDLMKAKDAYCRHHIWKQNPD